MSRSFWQKHICRTFAVLHSRRGLPHIVCVVIATLHCGCISQEQERLAQFSNDGVHLFHNGEYKGAEESFRAALELAPNDADLLYNIGRSCAYQGKWANAEKFYRECLVKKVNHEECRYALAVLLTRTNRKAEADAMIRQWLAQSPNLGGPYALDGWRLRAIGELQQAMGRLQQALAKDPQNLRAMTEMGRIYEQMNMPDRALVLYQRAARLHPNNPELAQRIAMLNKRKVGQPRPQW